LHFKTITYIKKIQDWKLQHVKLAAAAAVIFKKEDVLRGLETKMKTSFGCFKDNKLLAGLQAFCRDKGLSCWSRGRGGGCLRVLCD